MKLTNNAQEMVNRCKMDYLNETRECVFLSPLPKMHVGGREIGPFEEGEIIELENWIINILMKEGLVEISLENEYEAIVHLQRIYQQEKRQSSIQDVHQLTYAAIREKIRYLQGDRTSPDPILQQDIDKLEDILKNIVEVRLSKVIRTAKSGAYQDIQKQMTHEERWLCEEIIETLSEWRHYTKEEM